MEIAMLLAFGTLGFWVALTLLSASIWACLEWEKGWLATGSVVAFLVAFHFLGGRSVVPFIKEHYLLIFLGLAVYVAVGPFWGIFKWMIFCRDQAEEYNEAWSAFQKQLPGLQKSLAESRKLFAEVGRRLVEFCGQNKIPFERTNREGIELIVPNYRGLNLSEAVEEEYDELWRDYDQRWRSIQQLSQSLDWSRHVENRQFEENEFIYKPKPREHKARILMWMSYWPWSGVWFIINDPVKRLFRTIYQRISGGLERISERAFAGTEVHFSAKNEADK